MTVEPKCPIPSREIWGWLLDPEGNRKEALPVAVDLLWARDGEQWDAWEQQHHPESLLDITAMVLDYLAANMGGAPTSPVPFGGATPTPAPQAVGKSYARAQRRAAPVASDRGRDAPVSSVRGRLPTAPTLSARGRLPAAPVSTTRGNLLLPPPPPEGDHLLLQPHHQRT
ncbi:UNVERIFIED_CONTAM: hypothetical protein FKN15_029935 [Acipenser sinensis]